MNPERSRLPLSRASVTSGAGAISGAAGALQATAGQSMIADNRKPHCVARDRLYRLAARYEAPAEKV